LLTEKDRKLLCEVKQKLDETAKLMGELLETLEVLGDPELVKSVKQGEADVKAGIFEKLPDPED